MAEDSLQELALAVESQHGGRATLAQTVPVHETFQGKTVWEGIVHIFDLEGHPKATRAYAWSSPSGQNSPHCLAPKATRAYAWSSPVEGSDRRRFFAVLQMGAIETPLDAVRAAIVAEHRSRDA